MLIALILVAVAAPAGAAAAVEERTFLDSENLFPSGDANGTFGPANVYPAEILVPAVPGVVTKVTPTILDLGSGRAEDIDMALVAPGGAAVMLMSDACGSGGLVGNDWTFEDEAPTFLSQIDCEKGETGTFRPTNYFEEEHPDQLELSPGDGPPGPYGNELAALDGTPPGGDWSLFVLDDSSGVVGFEVGGWALTLQIETPPPSDTTSPPADTSPPASGGGGAAPVATPAPPPPAPAAKPKRTGRRAAALRKCKKKKPGKARARCRVHARKLPV
ncbi:MAG TPA: hypothetical protein VHZ54_06785 [Solirubrobacterales bacterium]|jgi:hypothetical protein|nr:hypothetical protein [Solirubrobacterales bacterium]